MRTYIRMDLIVIQQYQYLNTPLKIISSPSFKPTYHRSSRTATMELEQACHWLLVVDIILYGVFQCFVFVVVIYFMLYVLFVSSRQVLSQGRLMRV